MNKFEISPYGQLLVYKKGYTASIVEKIINEKKLKGLRIFAILEEDRLESIEFLKEFTFLENLEIISANDLDFTSLKYLRQLKNLTINVSGSNTIDLTHQVNLVSLTINWRKTIIGTTNCKDLKKLCLVESKDRNIDFILSFPALQDLIIKTASFTSLDDLNRSQEIRYISLNNCKQLEYIKGINGLNNLKVLEFDTCPKIKDYDLLLQLPLLEQLSLNNCKKIKSINFIQSFPKLKRLEMLGDTFIEDGNLIVTSKISEIFFTPRKHYNGAPTNKEYDDLIKENQKKLKDLL
jgi:hypothetical protein